MFCYGAYAEKEAEATAPVYVRRRRKTHVDEWDPKWDPKLEPKRCNEVAPITDRFCHDGGMIVFAIDVPRAKSLVWKHHTESGIQEDGSSGSCCSNGCSELMAHCFDFRSVVRLCFKGQKSGLDLGHLCGLHGFASTVLQIGECMS